MTITTIEFWRTPVCRADDHGICIANMCGCVCHPNEPIPPHNPHSKTCAQASQELADAYGTLKVDPTPANAREVAYLAAYWANLHATECEE